MTIGWENYCSFIYNAIYRGEAVARELSRFSLNRGWTAQCVSVIESHENVLDRPKKSLTYYNGGIAHSTHTHLQWSLFYLNASRTCIFLSITAGCIIKHSVWLLELGVGFLLWQKARLSFITFWNQKWVIFSL